ncbi:alpha-hydroxy-acid oxidizing protein [bacterium]|nr:alpha-hydroxy-acid oxidizing protein [bacterium]
MRNIDILVSPLEVLPTTRARLGPDIPVLADSGVQSRSDIFKLLRDGGRCGDGRQGGALCACLQWRGRRGKDDPHPPRRTGHHSYASQPALMRCTGPHHYP